MSETDIKHSLTSIVSWPAIVAGAAVAISLEIALAALCSGIGLSVASTRNVDPNTVPMAAGIAALVIGLISLFVGAWVMGRCAAFPRRSVGALNGFVMWGLMGAVALIIAALAGSQMMSGGMLAASNMAASTPPQQQGQMAAQASQAAQPAAKALAATGWYSFIALALGALVACCGGAIGARRDDTAGGTGSPRREGWTVGPQGHPGPA